MENKFIYHYAPKKSGGLSSLEREEVVVIRNDYERFCAQRSLEERVDAIEAGEKTGRRRKRQ